MNVQTVTPAPRPAIIFAPIIFSALLRILTGITTVITAEQTCAEVSHHRVDIELYRARHYDIVATAIEGMAWMYDYLSATTWMTTYFEPAYYAPAMHIPVVQAALSRHVVR
jgi:hypothetical protein